MLLFMYDLSKAPRVSLSLAGMLRFAFSHCTDQEIIFPTFPHQLANEYVYMSVKRTNISWLAFSSGSQHAGARFDVEEPSPWILTAKRDGDGTLFSRWINFEAGCAPARRFSPNCRDPSYGGVRIPDEGAEGWLAEVVEDIRVEQPGRLHRYVRPAARKFLRRRRHRFSLSISSLSLPFTPPFPSFSFSLSFI